VTPTTDRADATTTASTTTTALTTTTTAAAEPATIEVVAKDYAYSGLPSTIAAGSRISLTTEAGAEPHEITFMRVKDSDTRSFEEIQAEIAALPPDQVPPMLELPFALWIFSLPGETDSAILAGDGTLRPGRYTYFDTIHVGATFDSVQAYRTGMEAQGDSPMHATLGMVGWLTVE
jgi:plastocyanin